MRLYFTFNQSNGEKILQKKCNQNTPDYKHLACTLLQVSRLYSNAVTDSVVHVNKWNPVVAMQIFLEISGLLAAEWKYLITAQKQTNAWRNFFVEADSKL